ncbi:MAG: hypothetical protein ACOCWM_02950 [Cyclobacteriaceae bacterium]
MYSKSVFAFIIASLILFACNPDQKKYNQLFETSSEKYPNIKIFDIKDKLLLINQSAW